MKSYYLIFAALLLNGAAWASPDSDLKEYVLKSKTWKKVERSIQQNASERESLSISRDTLRCLGFFSEEEAKTVGTCLVSVSSSFVADYVYSINVFTRYNKRNNYHYRVISTQLLSLTHVD